MKTKSTMNRLTIAVWFAAAALFLSACQKDESLTSPVSSSSDGTSASVTFKSKTPAPVVPDSIAVPAGNEVVYHVYATGVQIYTCTETSPGVFAWVFTAPSASLYSNANFNGGGVGTHYAGPTWESNSGSKVVGARVNASNQSPTAIPWLLLRAVSSQGPGIFDGVTYIQRVNTVGGKAPATGANASTVGQQAQVSYTAEYFFFKAAD